MITSFPEYHNGMPCMQETFKRLVDAVPEIRFELYSFKSTIKCRERREQENWFESKVSYPLVIDLPR